MKTLQLESIELRVSVYCTTSSKLGFGIFNNHIVMVFLWHFEDYPTLVISTIVILLYPSL